MWSIYTNMHCSSNRYVRTHPFSFTRLIPWKGLKWWYTIYYYFLVPLMSEVVFQLRWSTRTSDLSNYLLNFCILRKRLIGWLCRLSIANVVEGASSRSRLTVGFGLTHQGRSREIQALVWWIRICSWSDPSSDVFFFERSFPAEYRETRKKKKEKVWALFLLLVSGPAAMRSWEMITVILLHCVNLTYVD